MREGRARRRAHTFKLLHLLLGFWVVGFNKGFGLMFTIHQVWQCKMHTECWLPVNTNLLTLLLPPSPLFLLASSPSPHLRGDAARTRLAAREDVGAETKVTVVRQRNGLLVGIKRRDAHHLRMPGGTGIVSEPSLL